MWALSANSFTCVLLASPCESRLLRRPRHGYTLGLFFCMSCMWNNLWEIVWFSISWGGTGSAPLLCALWLSQSPCIHGKSPLSASTQQYSGHWCVMMDDGTAFNRMLWIWPVFSLLLACCWFLKLYDWLVKCSLHAVSKGSGCFSDVWNK